MKVFLASYMPQVITVVGSLSGTFMGALLGWYLRYATENYGAMHIDAIDFVDRHTSMAEHEFCLKLHINNRSYRTKVVKELNIQFFKRRKLLKECCCRSVTVEPFYHPIHTEPKCGLVYLQGNAFQEISVTGVTECNNVHEATRYRITYMDIKGKRRKTEMFPCSIRSTQPCTNEAVCV